MASSQYSKSQELRNVHRLRKTECRGSSILEIDSQVYLTTPPPTYEDSTSPITGTCLLQRSNSLAPSYTSRSSASEPKESKKRGKSNKNWESIFKSITNSANEAGVKSDFESSDYELARKDLASIIYDCALHLDNFEFPSRLTFSSTAEDPLRLAKHEANNSFKRQLRQLNALRARLAEIATDDDERVMGVRVAAEIMIDTALQKMKQYQLEQFEQSSLATSSTPVASVDSVIRDLVVCVKSFKCPSELDFSANPQNPLVLAKNETNQPFIDQLCKLGQLRSRLAAIPTHGDSKLKKKHKAAQKSIECALKRMKEQQLKLYEQFRNAPLSQAAQDLDFLHADLLKSINAFRCPSELDLQVLEDGEDGGDKLVLPNTTVNRPFIAHLRELEWFRDQLNRIPTYDDAELKSKHRDVSIAIGKGLQSIKQYQRELYEQSVVA